MKKQLLFMFLFIAPSVASAQNGDATIMTVNGKDIKKSEFLYSYNKNNTEETVEKKSVNEYVELFKNFKLWIAEGESQYIDTTRAFRSELQEYRQQLSKPYLTEPAADEQMLRNEYERTKQAVKISHILVAFPGFEGQNIKTLAKDTAALYKKAVEINNKIKNGEKFATLANQYSDDNNKAQGGLMGWITGLHIAKPIEDAAFTIPVGKTGIVRSNWGYHILRVEEHIPYTEELHLAHILVRCDKDADTVQIADAEKKAQEAYAKVTDGADFGETADEYSDDKTKGGDLQWIDIFRTVPEFKETALKMKINEISRPFRTQFGFHIVKALESRPVSPFEEQKENIENSINNFGYFIPFHRSSIDKMKKESGFTNVETSYQKLVKTAETVHPAEATFANEFTDDNSELLNIGGTSYTIADFIVWLNTHNFSPSTLSTEFIADRLENYEFEMLYKKQDSDLENKYPEFRNLMQEYRDGIILFEIKNREIWEKASADTAGLAQFFADNRSNYTWDTPRFKGYVVLAKDSKTKKAMQKTVKKMKPENAIAYLTEHYKVGDVSYVKAEKGLFARGENTFVDKEIFKGTQEEYPENFSDFFLIGKTLTAPESADDIKGQIISDYQDYLEKVWTERLNEKYPVTINREVIDSLVK
ncbi:MAG: peptidylprolyl isomerase [Dysgonamonadaceae bacterium]|jgi:peptidyl-prolyl cis-trans isomerase SurA|nr:peptidylprolyl isomerase [Dysgonamonadaceae bacterium]